MSELKGKHVALIFVTGFSIIISVNLALAWNAVRTFPGLEVKNSYVASQSFDADRTAQLALGWEVSARLKDDNLVLEILKEGQAINPTILSAIFSRATSVSVDQRPQFAFDGAVFTAPVVAEAGNWNLRLVALAENGTEFRQRIIVEARQ